MPPAKEAEERARIAGEKGRAEEVRGLKVHAACRALRHRVIARPSRVYSFCLRLDDTALDKIATALAGDPSHREAATAALVNDFLKANEDCKARETKPVKPQPVAPKPASRNVAPEPAE